ncbi:hypothetical protein B194_0483 [Serratia plymuthica A30]|nr:hypothetical protein B194_0483 [Serratia plymuthica A30]
MNGVKIKTPCKVSFFSLRFRFSSSNQKQVLKQLCRINAAFLYLQQVVVCLFAKF